MSIKYIIADLSKIDRNELKKILMEAYNEGFKDGVKSAQKNKMTDIFQTSQETCTNELIDNTEINSNTIFTHDDSNTFYNSVEYINPNIIYDNYNNSTISIGATVNNSEIIQTTAKTMDKLASTLNNCNTITISYSEPEF